jgi:subtilisin family serine protease
MFTGSPADATAAIRDAGGTVLAVNQAIGAALVSSSNRAFLAQVRAHGLVTGAAHNTAIGYTSSDMPRRFAEERPEVYGPPVSVEQALAARSGVQSLPLRPEEPLNPLQWDMQMIGANANGAHRTTTGRTVLVGVIDTGVDGSHPDIAPNFDRRRSRNFTTDIPAIDGACEDPTCTDPADVDHNGHGTHVAGVIGAKKNKFGMAGVAPRARIVNVRAGQDSGYFFLYETVAALTYAADAGLDVVNMSFYTDPWLFNCDSADDYLAGAVTSQQLAEQALTKQLVTAALEYAHAHGVTLVASAGNAHTNYAAPTRTDFSSPDYPPGTAAGRVVTSDCLDVPAEGPHVISVGAVGPSTTKADYSNYGYPSIDVSAPGGFFRDFFGTPQHRVQANLVLSTYPLAVAIAEGLADANGNPTNDASVKACNRSGRRCALYTYLQGTSMAAPHVTGVVALIIERHGLYVKDGKSLDPDAVRQILLSTATDHACPAGGVEDYQDEGRPADWNAVCDGSTAVNGLYGEGIVDALAAVQ